MGWWILVNFIRQPMLKLPTHSGLHEFSVPTLSGSPKPVSSKNSIGLVVWCFWWPDWSSEFESSQV